MAYPADIDSFPTFTNETLSLDNHANMENAQASSIVAVETELGVNPSGAFSTLAERLAAGLGGNEFKGDWEAGVAYQDGDIVIYDGIPYMAVDPSTGTAPDPWAVEGAGIQGPVGPPGPPGGALVTGWWMYAISTSPPPLSGQVRTAPDPAVIDQTYTIYLHATDADGLVWSGTGIEVGDQVRLRGSSGIVQTCLVTGYSITGSGPTAYATIVTTVLGLTGQITKNARVEVALVKQGPTGPQGPQGIQGVKGDTGDTGAQGDPGEKWFTGSGAPAGATGIVGDWYLDSATGDYYEKTGASAWTSRGNIKGPQGIQGTTGNTGTTGTPGEKWFSQTGAPAGGTGIVGDWSIATDTGEIYEKTGASTWTSRGNIKGPQGNTGSQGIQGPAGVAGPWRMGQTWAIDGEIIAGTMPVIFIPLAGTQTCTLVGVRAKIGSGTSITAQMQRNGSNLGSAITVTTTAALTAFSQAFVDADQLGLVLSAPVGTPIDLSLTAILQHQA